MAIAVQHVQCEVHTDVGYNGNMYHIFGIISFTTKGRMPI